MAVQLPHKRFTVEEYHKMLDAGILQEDDRVELIEGEIVTVAPIRMRHIMCLNRLVSILGEKVRGRAMVSPQNSLILDDETEVEPDVALLRLREYKDEELAPRAADALLVIEIADTTVSDDRRVKAPRYAHAGISEFWLVNVPKKVVEVYSSPSGGTYKNVWRAKRGDSLELQSFSGVTVKVEDFLT